MKNRLSLTLCFIIYLFMWACADSTSDQSVVIKDAETQPPSEVDEEPEVLDQIENTTTYARDSSWTRVSIEEIGLHFEIPTSFVDSETLTGKETSDGAPISSRYIYSHEDADTKISIQFYFGEGGNGIFESNFKKMSAENIPLSDISVLELDGCKAIRKTMIVTNNGRGRELGMELRREQVLIRPNGRDGSFWITYSSDAVKDAGIGEIDQIIRSIELD